LHGETFDGKLDRIERNILDLAAEVEGSLEAVELLNVLRPTVAVSRYVAFAALDETERLVSNDRP
jgi:hypothetical protein